MPRLKFEFWPFFKDYQSELDSKMVSEAPPTFCCDSLSLPIFPLGGFSCLWFAKAQRKKWASTTWFRCVHLWLRCVSRSHFPLLWWSRGSGFMFNSTSKICSFPLCPRVMWQKIPDQQTSHLSGLSDVFTAAGSSYASSSSLCNLHEVNQSVNLH